ncbi:MAG: bifunctional phosphopantothenoylcysteine decarboxylase/phosphopantothenate--cysteine ligase CoaBC [Pseudomonadota bacterium]|nr:bifunctional phosphopantothenoylcysteine decarboxylase/phosphopantothenate--cysteine ligase CoaBC [Pseudomonadota bacterium]
MNLTNRHLLLGVTGGIAAYKAAELARLLVKAGAEVQVVMTQAATRFVAPLTFEALTGNTVRTDLFDSAHEAAMGHIELARWADLVVVAPATADFMARLAVGRADDLLTTLCVATTAPVAVAPAMNQQMWANAATQKSIKTLQGHDNLIWGPAAGEQACGDVGPGRLFEAAQLFQLVCEHFATGLFAGVRALITAGPTHEALDPVRFIGNRSSGRMGFAMAQALVEEGAEVTLVAGPVSMTTPRGVTRIDVESAMQMHSEVMQRVATCDLFVATAAVADYRPQQTAVEKIKKSGEKLTIDLIRNPDILANVAALENSPYTVGFAAETERLEEYAQRKRIDKRIDMIAANLVGAAEGGFESTQNALTLFWEGGQLQLPLTDKLRLARQFITLMSEHFYARTGT